MAKMKRFFKTKFQLWMEISKNSQFQHNLETYHELSSRLKR